MRLSTLARVGRRERDLLADDRRASSVSKASTKRSSWFCSVPRQREHAGAEEAEDGVDAAVVQEAEAADLRAARRRADAGRAEHADLLVDVPQVRDLEHLGLALERAEARRCRRSRARGSSVWQPLQLKTTSVIGPK